jgi:hypothetical protein
MASRRFLPNETVYCRFTGEAFTVVSCNGCVVELSDGTGRIVGELTRTAPQLIDGARDGIIEALGGMLAVRA